MRSKIVKYIFKKEMLDILRDKKTLFMMIILPVILYPIMMILLTQVMTMSTNSMNEKELPIAIKGNADSQLISMINDNDQQNEKEKSGKLKIVKVKDYKKAINDESIVAYIEVKDDNKKYNIYINSSVSDSNTAMERIEKIFDDYKQEKINENLKEKGLDVEQTLEPIVYKNIDIAENEELAGYMLGQILPFILILFEEEINKCGSFFENLLLLKTIVFGILIGVSDYYYADFYRKKAAEIQFQGHIIWATGHWG